MNLITDDKRAFEYNYSHVSEEAKRKLFHLKWLISCQDISEGITTLWDSESFKKINSAADQGKEFKEDPS